MNKIIALVGYSASGKDLIVENLSYELKIPIVVSHTTRDMRTYELNGINYHFVNEDFFIDNKDDFIEQRLYKVKSSNGKDKIWRYGIHKNSVKEGSNLVIVDPQGLNELINYYGKENIITFYIYASDEVRMKRLQERGDFSNVAEINRRFKDDKKRFKDFIESKDYYKICNEYDLSLAINEIKSVLKKVL